GSEYPDYAHVPRLAGLGVFYPEVEVFGQVLVVGVEASELHGRRHRGTEGGDVPGGREVAGDQRGVLLGLQGLPHLAGGAVTPRGSLEAVVDAVGVAPVHALYVQRLRSSVGAPLLDLRREVGDLADSPH